MDFIKPSYRYRVQLIFAISIIFFTSTCIIQILSVPSPSATTEPAYLADNPQLYPEVPTGVDSSEILQFYSTPDVKLPSKHSVVLRGQEHLPRYLKKNMEFEKESFQYQLQPFRIVGKNGLLALREFQGNSWSGTLMKGALVFFVRSKAGQSKTRNLLRSTWCSVRDVDGWKIEVVFVVGQPSSPRTQQQVEEESKRYGDILQYVGPDRGNSVTLKVLSGLQWAATRLPGDFYYGSVNEEVLVNIGKVRDRMDLESIRDPPTKLVHMATASDGSTVTSSQPQYIYCFDKIVEPHSVNSTAWSWLGLNWPRNIGIWPPYCREGLYIFPVSLAEELDAEWRRINSSLPDQSHDILVTGILRRKLNRGDNNIVDATAEASVFRFDSFVQTHTPKFKQLYSSLENQLHAVWSDWYSSISKRYHIITYNKDWT